MHLVMQSMHIAKCAKARPTIYFLKIWQIVALRRERTCHLKDIVYATDLKPRIENRTPPCNTKRSK